MAVPSRRVADDAPPIGRDAEAARLAHLVNDAAAGAKRAALLLGVPGIGKTTLLRFVRARAHERGFMTAFIRVPATAGLPPRFPLGELLGALAESLTSNGIDPPERLRRVVDTLTGATSVEQYAVALPHIADALEESGRWGPIGVFIDDYDWAPPEGTELLIAALRVVEIPVCFVATARLRGAGEEPPSPLPAPTADLWIDHIEVRGLDPGSVAALAARQIGGEVLPSLADALFARTLGNPLFVAETLQAWREQDALVVTGGYVGLAEDPTLRDAGSLRDMIATRLAKLEDDALAVAGALAVIGREATFQELCAASELTQERLVEMLSVLTREGFVATDDHPSPHYRITHPLYAASLVDALGAARVASLHGRICEEWRRRTSSGERLSASERAHHAVRALDPPRDMRLLLAAAAIEAESAGSLEEAAIWYGYLAEVTDDPHELVRALSGQAAASLRSDPSRAVHLFTYALELETNPAARARLLLGRARAHRVAGLYEPALSDLQQALPLADPADAFDIRHATGAANGIAGRTDAAEEVFRALAAEFEGSPQRWKAWGHLGMTAFIRGDVVEGTRLHEEALRGTDDPGYALHLQTNLAWMLVLLGRWDEAEELQRVALSAAVAAGNIPDEATLSCVIGRLAAWRGNLPVAFDAARRALTIGSRLGNPADLINAHDALALSLLENDMPSDAAALLSEVLVLDQPGVEPREFSMTYSILAEACLEIGDLGRARTAVSRARHHLATAKFWKVAVDRVEAQIDRTLGDALGALERLRPWLDHPSAVAFEQARVLEVVSQALFAIGDRAGAHMRAQEALSTYERLGASRRASRLAAWLVDHTPRRPGRPRSTLPGHLTARETEILRLVVLGRSNREIAAELYISLGTVKKHVENIMSKSGASRRTELVPFAVGIGALAVEDLRAPSKLEWGKDGGATPRVIRLDRLEPSDPVSKD